MQRTPHSPKGRLVPADLPVKRSRAHTEHHNTPAMNEPQTEYDIPLNLQGHTVHTPRGAMRLDRNLPQKDRQYLFEAIRYPLIPRKVTPDPQPSSIKGSLKAMQGKEEGQPAPPESMSPATPENKPENKLK